MAGKIKAALLVDADNLPTAQAEDALEKLAEICNPVIKKAFGDFTKSAKNWSPEFMRKHGFTPEMHFAVSNFKNGADIAMCIAAMDIVHAKSVEAIVLFTSDSDFASLAARIREAGLEVVGVGDAKASEVLRSAFDTFIVVEPPNKAISVPLVMVPKAIKAAPKPAKADSMPIVDPVSPAQKTKAEALNGSAKVLQNIANDKPKNAIPKPASKSKAIPKTIRKLIVLEVKAAQQEGTQAMVSRINNKVKAEIPNFSHKTYGFAKMSSLLNSMNEVILINENKAVKLAANQGSK